jgi:hypothetical protein
VTFVVAGQSNADGVDDDEHDEELLPAGVEINDKGVDLTAYPDGGTRHSGLLPYLVEYALANGATGVRILREATPGQNIVACIDDVAVIRTRLAAKGWTPDYWILWQGEAETLDPAQSPAALYGDRLDQYARLVLGPYRNCRVVLPTLLMRTDNYSGAGASDDWPLIVDAQIDVAASWPDRVLLVDTQIPTVLPIVSTVHASPNDGGGHDQCMQRFRDLWSL